MKKAVISSFQKPCNSKGVGGKQTTGSRKSRSQTHGAAVTGTNMHKRLKEYIEKRKRNENTDAPELKQAKELVRKIEEGFNCKIVNCEVRIQGFASKVHKKDFWSGKIDAVGLTKDGRVIVIDLATYKGDDPEKSYWDSVDHYKDKLHQSFVYKKLLDVHLREYFKDKKIPPAGIMIVAMRQTTDEIDERLCLDFKELQDAGFFEKIDEFAWHIHSSRQEEQNKVLIYLAKTLCRS